MGNLRACSVAPVYQASEELGLARGLPVGGPALTAMRGLVLAHKPQVLMCLHHAHAVQAQYSTEHARSASLHTFFTGQSYSSASLSLAASPLVTPSRRHATAPSYLVGRMDVDLVQQQLDLLGCVLRNGGCIMAPCYKGRYVSKSSRTRMALCTMPRLARRHAARPGF